MLQLTGSTMVLNISDAIVNNLDVRIPVIIFGNLVGGSEGLLWSGWGDGGSLSRRDIAASLGYPKFNSS